jgi:hypothetical protein
VLFSRYYYGDKVKKGEMAGACRKHGKAEKCVKFVFGRPDIKLILRRAFSHCEYLTKYEEQNNF